MEFTGQQTFSAFMIKIIFLFDKELLASKNSNNKKNRLGTFLQKNIL